MDASSDLTPLEQAYRQKLLALFSRVDAQHPERGVKTLLTRARHRAEREGTHYQDALEEMYQGAVERTERRIQLLNQCSLKKTEQ